MKSRSQRLREAAPGFARRRVKHLSQLRFGWNHPKQLVFVFGCQRSGTKMLMRVLDRSPGIRIYHENHASAFSNFRLRSDAVVRALYRLNTAPSVIFKPICDSQLADGLMKRFPEAHGIWIHRKADDVANSAVHKWGDHQRQVIDSLVAGDVERWGWRTDRVPPEVVEAIRGVHRADLSSEEGALLFWYLRNAFYFSLGLDLHPRMRLVRYEDLVLDPAGAFPPIFEHVGVPYEERFLDRVKTTSVGRRAAPESSPEIRALCDGLTERLAAA